MSKEVLLKIDDLTIVVDLCNIKSFTIRDDEISIGDGETYEFKQYKDINEVKDLLLKMLDIELPVTKYYHVYKDFNDQYIEIEIDDVGQCINENSKDHEIKQFNKMHKDKRQYEI